MSKTQAILDLVEAKVVKATVRRYAYRHPSLAEDFAQEAAMAIIKAQDRILGASHLDGFLKFVVRGACFNLIQREYQRPFRKHRRPQPRRRDPHRRNLQEVLRNLNGREPRPDFLAEVREELGHEERVIPSTQPYSRTRLTAEQRATLRLILHEAEGWSTQEIAAEFRRQTGRGFSATGIARYRKELGLAPAEPNAIRRRRFEAGAYDRWDCRVPTVV
jgi:DNA-directed RNA polymerase specialized sigma24 family protein